MELKKATRSQVKLRIGLSSPSGGGKTYTSLILAHGMCGDWSKIALIDSENGSGELYSDLGEYNVLTLEAPFAPERYIEAIELCEKSGMEIIIIDSISHEWEGKGGCLEINDAIAQSKFKGNTWSAWSVTGTRHQKFLEKITTSPCHIITTVRNKIETAQVEGRIKKVGTKELTREGFEYELTVNFNLERDSHKAIASKDRTGLYIDRDPFLITEETGKEIIEWNKSGKMIKSLKEKQMDRYEEISKEIIMCKNKEMIDLIFSNLREEVKNNGKLLTKDQLQELGKTKNDMIINFETKKSNKKQVEKTATTTVKKTTKENLTK